MKISRRGLVSGTVEFNSVEEAIKDACIPNPYSYEDRIGKLENEIENQRGIIARLIEVLYGERRLVNVDAVKYILGYGYEVEE